MTTAAEKPAGAVASARRPNLWLTESLLRRAHEALAEVDPDCEMSLDQATALLSEYVSPQAVVAKRDELARFLRESERFADAKAAEAADLVSAAKKIMLGVARMEQRVVTLMQSMGVDQLAGDVHVLKLKKSPGSVAVDDEAAIPPEYFRITSDADLEAIRTLVGILVALLPQTQTRTEDGQEVVEPNEDRVCALELLEAAELRRRAVDKKAIQEAWRQEGGDRRPLAESDEVNIVDGLRVLGDVPADRPVVPGVHKDVTTSLVIR